MRNQTPKRVEARGLQSPWYFWVLLLAAGIIFSFGCSSGGNIELIDQGNTGGVVDGGGGGTGGGDAGGGGGGDGGGGGVTGIGISTTLSSTVINNVDSDERDAVSFSFDQPMDTETAANYITVSMQHEDGSLEAIPLQAIEWSEARTVSLSFVATYNTSYVVTINAGLRSADLLTTLTQSVSYELRTPRNPLDIDGLEGDRADLVLGYDQYQDGEGTRIGIGALYSDQDLVTAILADDPIMCDLVSLQCNRADWGAPRTTWSYGKDQNTRSDIGTDAYRLGNVSGDWRADIAIGANQKTGEPYCAEGTGTCTEGMCIVPSEAQGVGCGCNGTDTCNTNVYFSWPALVACIPAAGLLGCSVDSDCTDLHGLGAGYYCKDAGVGYPDFCASTSGTCGTPKCNETDFNWYCNTDAGNECYSYELNSGNCLQDTEAIVMVWDDVTQAAPTAVLTSDNTGTTAFVRPIGDVNGDGKADMIVVEQVEGKDVEHRHYLFLGRTSFSGEVKLSTADADWSETNVLTMSVAALGDVNGDGINDFAIGSVPAGLLANEAVTGTVKIYFGTSDVNALKTADVTLTSTNADDLFGISVSGGDVDGDGYADVLVGAPGQWGIAPEATTNHAYLFSGARLAAAALPSASIAPIVVDASAIVIGSGNGTLTTADATATFSEDVPPDSSPMLGLATAIVDMNGDRLGDILIGEPFMPVDTSYGRVAIFLGKRGISGTVNLSTADLFINHNWPAGDGKFGDTDYRLGVILMPIGDLNNDGYKDLAVIGITVKGAMIRQPQANGNFMCTFLGKASLAGSNLTCDDSPSWIAKFTIPVLLYEFLGGTFGGQG